MPERFYFTKSKPTHCARCGVRFARPSMLPGRMNLAESRTIDHVLPKRLGGTRVLFGDVRNFQWICKACNMWRANCGDCWALAACVETVTRSRKVPRKQVYKEWGLGALRAAQIRIAVATQSSRVFREKVKE